MTRGSFVNRLYRKKRGSSTPTPVNTTITSTSSVYRRARKRRTCKDPNRKQDPHYVNTIQLEYQLQPEDISGHRQEDFTFNFRMQPVPRAEASQNSSAETSRQMAPHSNNTAVYASGSMQWPCTADQDFLLQDEGDHSQLTPSPASNDPSQTLSLIPSYPQASMFLTHSVPDNAPWDNAPTNNDSSQFSHYCGFTGAFLASSNSQVLSQDDYLSHQYQEQFRGHVHAPMREENSFGINDAFFGNTFGMPARSPSQSDIHRFGNSYYGCNF
ncbi:hypothetical protein E1B28_004819 [Marasmius oreades]|uniref:Uncharacterized protein n=1 Tax=Marasmius oreades TaxID=181124 RepID=A0A9P7UZF0_9AGAR|nr:uncharacterized protein E1B28_004819 [Marasmius oreades]KAG7097477.1 hypothetical protein E1B28_004819 [Marasmius oreades]